MKTQAECYQALLDGKTLEDGNNRLEVKLIEGVQWRKQGDASTFTKSSTANNIGFLLPNNWSIKEEPRPPLHEYAYVVSYGRIHRYTKEKPMDNYEIRSPGYDIIHEVKK